MNSPHGITRPAGSMTKPTLDYPIQPNLAIHDPGQMSPRVTLTCIPEYHPRHHKQLRRDKIAALNTKLTDLIIDTTEYCACYKVDNNAQASLSLNDERIFQSYLYLFSILIAFEWQPSLRTLQRVQLAAKKASDLLYDVTDGFMAIGQVIVGDRNLLDVADIQVMASNRFHPRAWNGALHYPEKYQPIRVGRGLWRKDHGFLMEWDESDAYRVLVHEWGHYALGLVDEYLDLVRLGRDRRAQWQWRGEPAQTLTKQHWNNLNIVAPSIALPVESIMATLASSELIPRHESESPRRRTYMLQKIQQHFPEVAPKEPLDGPAELPLALPGFPRQYGPSLAPEEIHLSNADLRQLRSRLTSNGAWPLAGNCWVYILKCNNLIVGQGVIGPRDWNEGFALLGAATGDQVVVIAQTENPKTRTSRVQVMSGALCIVSNMGLQGIMWNDITPDVLPDFIDVLPEMLPGQAQLPTNVRVQIEIEPRGWLPEVWVAALGRAPELLRWENQTPVFYPDGNPRVRLISEIKPFFHLDGHILLRWTNGKQYICGYSHGGGPCTSGGGYCASYTAGSYEGNAMVFYLANYDASDSKTRVLAGVTPIPAPDQNTRIVSTVMHGGPQYIPLPSGDYAEARSYIFSLGSNQPLGALSATLVLYYDYGARKRDGELLIYRWAGKDGWQCLTTYAPENQPYVCIPLDQATPETSSTTISRPGEFFDRYRIYWTPPIQGWRVLWTFAKTRLGILGRQFVRSVFRV